MLLFVLFLSALKIALTITLNLGRVLNFSERIYIILLFFSTGLWLGRPGCLEAFDKLVPDFIKASEDKKSSILGEAEKTAQGLSKDEDKLAADTYIKTMKKVLDKGNGFIKDEVTRVEKLRSGKVSDNKKKQLGDRLNILASFQLGLKDEL